MAKAKSAYDELAHLRSVAAGERVRSRDVEQQLEVAEEAVDRAREQVIESLAADDAKAVASAREAGDKAGTLASELREQAEAGQLRVLRAQAQADSYAHDNAEQLLDEQMANAERIAARLNVGVLDVLAQHRALLDSRQSMDRIISAGGGEPRSDGPAPTHDWEKALNELARAVAQAPHLAAPRPRWLGQAARAERDRVHRALQEQRA